MRLSFFDLTELELTKDYVDSVALTATDYSHPVIVLNSNNELFFKENIENGFNVDYIVNSEIIIEDIITLYCVLFNLSDYNLVSVDEAGCASIETKNNTLHFKEQSSLVAINREFNVKAKAVKEKLSSEKLSNIWSLYSSYIFSIKSRELDFLTGQSFMDSIDLYDRATDDTIDILKIKELTNLIEYYKAKNKEFNFAFDDYLSDKVSSIESFVSDNLTNSGELRQISSFPVSYKYLSSFLYIAAKEMYFSQNITASYLMIFRSFETYCEGMLISRNKAKVEKYKNKGNCFLLEQEGKYQKTLGFGNKWGVIKEAGFFRGCEKQIYDNLSKHKDIRNILQFTHGDVLVNSELLYHFDAAVKAMITHFDCIGAQEKFKWESVMERIKSAFVYNPMPYVAKQLITESGLYLKKYS
ncbi:hypothetical protein [Photobacterium angustum]|uniref:hypothetical protein n=1 Tax=Photobacterium angustum TaxID=661 RepID=UPI0005E659B3|nr:hypothetical protein [Photobacterium angustum]KJG02106.1 hypothetical protein UB35_08070 [Photobacterium angustum]PSV65852.1 hypothetical protein CTM95_14010 [Photobacterium angustum]